VIGGRASTAPEIRDAMAYCRVTCSPTTISASSALQHAAPRAGESALRTLRLIQRAQRCRCSRDRRALETDELKRGRADAGRPHQELRSLARHARRMNHIEVVETILDESGYTDNAARRSLARGAGRLRRT